MHTLLRLPLILLEMALRGGVRALLDLLRRSEGERPYVPSPEAEAEAAAAAAARREAERVAAAEAAARRPAARPSAAPRRPPPRPVEAVPAPPAHVSSEPEEVASYGPADEPGARVQVDAPWPGYDQHPASEVIKRVRMGDDATRAVVLLYERTHKARKSVIAAAEASPP
jgi:hypothetical protein